MINGLPANSFLVIQVFVWGCRRISPAHLALSSSIEAAKVPPRFLVWEKGHKDEETGSGGWWDHITPHLYHHGKSKTAELALNRGTCSREFELFSKRSHGGDLRTWVRFPFLSVPRAEARVPRIQLSGEKGCFGTSLKYYIQVSWGPQESGVEQTLHLFWLMKRGRTYPRHSQFFKERREWNNWFMKTESASLAKYKTSVKWTNLGSFSERKK